MNQSETETVYLFFLNQTQISVTTVFLINLIHLLLFRHCYIHGTCRLTRTKKNYYNLSHLPTQSATFPFERIFHFNLSDGKYLFPNRECLLCKMGSFKTTTEVTDDSATETDCDATATSEKTKSDSDSDIDIDIDIDNDTGDDCPPPPDSSPFAEGEKVLAFHNCRIYEAKITKLDHRMKEWRFHLHYLGWNKSWDEWVGVDRLLKYTEENVQKQQELNKKDGNDKNSRAARASHMKPKSSNVARGKKRKNDSISKEKAATPLDKLVNIQIPLTLKKQLVDDCEFITHLGKLVKLPRVPNVDDILKKYLDYRLKKDGLIGDSVGEIVKGLCCYFDKALPVILLYNNERQQYEEACASDVFPSTVYGAEHLLRLFVKLPEFLFHANIEEETLMELQTNLVDFLKFLQKNQSLFFLSTYHVPEDIENCPNKQDD